MRLAAQKLERRIAELSLFRYRERRVLDGLKIILSGDSLEEARAGEGGPVYEGLRWGGRDQYAWFIGSVEFPDAWSGLDVVALIRLGETGSGNCSGYEALAYLNGEPLQALDRNHAELFFGPKIASGGRAELAIRAWSGLTPPDGTHQPFDHRINQLEIGILDEITDDLYYTSLHMLATAQGLEERSPEKHLMMEALEASFRCLDWREPGSSSFYDAVAEARNELRRRLESIPRGQRPQVTAVGHSHIDVAWLWRLQHTREKSGRSFSTVLQLMERYPEYVFLQSQPQLYAYLKKDYPSLYEKIKQKAAEGKWEPTGAMWLESDCNIPSGESLVRQLLVGKRFFRKEFGVDNRMLWLPDVFGYSWALPQILKKSGIDYFMTTKISWSQYNRFPHDTFKWRGIDGTEMLTHFITTPNNDGSWYYTYNGDVSATSIMGLWDNYRQKEINDELLLAFGWGDGGGGPTRDMLEGLRRFEDMPGAPQVRQGKAEDYFEQLDSRLADHPQLPLWDGELYLEYHRGTYTSQAHNKRMNRTMERLLHDAEFLNAFALVLDERHAYPSRLLDESWEIVLRNQFHDIIPGSSIKEVYEDSRVEYEEAEALAVQALNHGVSALDGKGNALDGTDKISDGTDQVLVGKEQVYRVFNSLGWERSFPVEIVLPAGIAFAEWRTSSGELLETQTVTDGKGPGSKTLVSVKNVPAYGYVTLVASGATSVQADKGLVLEQAADKTLMHSADWQIDPQRIETPFYHIELNASGQIVSLYDKIAGRQVLASGEPANVLQVFEDKPLANDAWDIDIFYQDKMWEVTELLEVSVVEEGPLRAALGLKWKFHKSEIEQRLVVFRDDPRIDFETRVEWHEQQHLLKASFPVDIRSTKATYEIQFGNVERPTHWNTSWDYARFESVAQRWVDLSEGGYGVSLLNDSKYGHDIRNHTLRLSLIKSAVYPDQTADQGLHEFTYSLLPHNGGWLEAGTHAKACELNTPMFAATAVSGGKLQDRQGLLWCDRQNVMIDTVKKAEDDDSLIVRLYEYGGIRGKAKILVDSKRLRIIRAEETDMMEESLGEVPADFVVSEHEIEMDLKPYEIKTIRIVVRSH
jgi:alpha-mannosidase